MDSLKGVSVGLFCGIGNPKRFVRTAQELGANVVASYFLPDHKPIGKRALTSFATLSKERGAEVLLCTEKDKIKLPPIEEEIALPIGWIETGFEIFKNREAWENMLCQLQQ